MSIHKSLKIDKYKKKNRAVRSRLERIKKLISEDAFSNVNIFNLPKEKIVIMKKVRKEEKKTEEEVGEQTDV